MKKRMKKVATLCLAGVTAMSTVGVTGSAVFAKGDTNYDVDNMDFENVELRVAFRFNNGSDTDGQAKWYYKALDEFNKENEGKIHVTDESISTESDYEEKLTTDFASGNVPNAFLQYGGSRTREYVDAGYILDLTPYFEQYTDPDQQHCNSIKCKEQPVLSDPDLCCVWYVPGDIPLYRIHGWNLQEPG